MPRPDTVRWVVVVMADETASFSIYGTFKERDTAKAFADRVNQQFAKAARHDLHAVALPMRAPLVRSVVRDGWL